MPVDPFLEPLLAAYPQVPEHIPDYPVAREQSRLAADAMTAQLAEPGPVVWDRRRVTIPVQDGTIDLLIYQPFEPGPHPVHLFLHGGGWVVGSIDHSQIDITCRERCVGARCVVVSVDYRKAPEHRFPIPLDDCYAALVWVADHAKELGIRTDRITLGGQSAGGNLAAALALKVRDDGGPALAFQLLEVPALDLTFGLPSHETYGTGYALALRDLELAREAYLGSPDEATHPYASPLHARDLSGLPPAHIMIAEYDTLRDDGTEYARRLAEAGVPVTVSLQKGHVHISAGLTAVMQSAREWRREMLTVLQRAHGDGAAESDVAS